MTYTVRLVTTDTAETDIKKIAKLLPLELKEAGEFLQKFPPNHRRVMAMLTAVQKHGCLIKTEDERGNIVGTFGLFPNNYWWSETVYLQDLALFVHPDHRKSTIAREMVDLGRFYAKTTGFPVVISLQTEKQLERKKNLFRRMGLKQVGALFTAE